MYEAYYGLTERPFELTTSPRYLFLSPRHREALSTLQYGLSNRKGIVALLGEAGTGKTTLIRAALDGLRGPQLTAVYLNNPTLSRAELLDFLAVGFGLSEAAASSKSRFLMELQRTVAERRARGGSSALIVDEAQSLPHELLEEIRLLSNIEGPDDRLLAVVLAGQPELAERLNQPSLRQLKQRIALRATLAPLELRETGAYVAKRIRMAGGDAARLFTRDAIVVLHERSGGIPRTVNVICDNALVAGFALQRQPVDADLVEEACRELDLIAPSATTDVPEELAFAGSNGHRPAAFADVAAAPPLERVGAAGPEPVREYFTAVTKPRRFWFF